MPKMKSDILLTREDVDIYVHKFFRKRNWNDILKRTSHLVIAAHQDDIEIMAFHGIQECYKSRSQWLTGVTVTDGRGSARTGKFKNYTDDQMAEVRRKEQRRAAEVGDYLCQVQLGYRSAEIKTKTEVLEDLVEILTLTQPKYVYIHNPFDKHDTHVATCLHSIKAMRFLKGQWQPKKVYGCEVWRGLDWMNSPSKLELPVSKYPKLRLKLCQIFKSQVQGGKRYDLGVEGRRRANATFNDSRAVDTETHITFAYDLTKLVSEEVDIKTEIAKELDSFKNQVLQTVGIFL